ncbi:MAG: nitroreductase family deazaflavin-dependent oxidoreductase [Streptosporangiaceae bacterium]
MARYLQPNKLISKVANPLVMRLGAATALAVRGRTTGETRTVPVNVLEHEGHRYLVAPRGDTQWARNLRAAGRGELRRRGEAEAFVAEEVPAEQRDPIIGAYRQLWGSQAKKAFETLADPADHPVFRILPPG